MSIASMMTPETLAQNRSAFDTALNKLNGQSLIISKIKTEISSLQGKFVAMLEILKQFPDQITILERQLYDTQCQAFIHAIFMYVNYRDSLGNLYIEPVTPASQTTNIILNVAFPHYFVSKSIASLDNIAVDIASWDMYIGTTHFTASHSSDLATQFSGINNEEPSPYFSQIEFVTGIAGEIEKLVLFTSQIIRNEHEITAGIRIISELKGLGLY